ncbi:MAG TPA: hypothetical protein VGK67_30400 [Myxococcales bacterium]
MSFEAVAQSTESEAGMGEGKRLVRGLGAAGSRRVHFAALGWPQR